MLIAHIKMKYLSNKKGLFGLPLLLIFLGLLVMLILILIFKDRLVGLLESFNGILSGKRMIWAIVLLLVIVFRKFVLEILMWILKILKGVLRI